MLPYLIAGAIGFGIGKLFEEGGETFMAGGMTNEDILRSFLTSERETQTNNLATFYSTLGGVMLLRNYGTLIAKRMGRNVEITNVKHSKTTSAITNRLKALAEGMGYNVSYVSEFENGGGVGKYNTYKLRAEGLNDFMNFLGTGVYSNVKSYTVEPIGFPDVAVSFETNLSLSEIKAKLREVQDSHVMLDTIKPIKEYTGERYDDGEFSDSYYGGETFMAGGRITKYVQLYFVQGNYGQGFEDLTAHDNRKDAIAEMRVYDDNESYPHRVIQRRVLRTDYEKGNYADGGGVEYRIGGEVDKELTIEQTRKIAQETANILGTEFSVTKNSVDVASFDLDLNGEEFEGGSYLIMKNGDVLNVALPNNPVYYNYKERSKNPKMIRTIFEEEYFENFDNGGESDDNYGGQRNKIVTELKGMKGGLNNKAPYVFLKEGYIYVSAENGDNYADYYEYTIDEKLEDLADRYNTYWDWETAGSIVLAPIDTYAGGGVAKKRRRSASAQYGRSNTAVDKTRVAKPVGYRYTDEKATQLNKKTYTKPTEAQVKKYLGNGIYKENRKNRSDRDRNAKL